MARRYLPRTIVRDGSGMTSFTVLPTTISRLSPVTLRNAALTESTFGFNRQVENDIPDGVVDRDLFLFAFAQRLGALAQFEVRLRQLVDGGTEVENVALVV